MTVPVLTYHAIEELPPPVGISRARFTRHVDWLSDAGIRSVTLPEVLAMLDAGNQAHASVAITFDDGYDSVARVALPLLARSGFTATVFVVPRHVGRDNDFPGQPAWVQRRRLLDWGALKELLAAGWQIGAHGLTHQRLDRAAPEALDEEMRVAALEIGDRLGVRPNQLAYPYGCHSADVRRVAARYFGAAWTAEPGLIAPGADRFRLPRIDAYDVSRAILFRQLFTSMMPAYLAVRRTLRNARRSWS